MSPSADQEPNATIVRREELAAGLFVLHLELDGGERLEFEPGQFVSIAATADTPEGARVVKRPYSIASAPGALPIELLLRHVDGGALSPKLWRLEERDRLRVDRRCLGRFGLADVPENADVVGVATGTGLAPFVSMLRAYAGRGRWRRFALVHGVRTSPELAYRAELEGLAAAHADVAYLPVLSREPHHTGWGGLRGRVGDALASPRFGELAGFELDPAHAHVLLCGNPEMVDQQLETLAERGFRAHRPRTPGNLHAERYWKTPSPRRA